MCKGWLIGAALIVYGSGIITLSAQSGAVCECGAHPPLPPKDRAVSPYAGEPEDLSPYAKFTVPYDRNYIHPNLYSGAARDLPEPAGLTEVRIGFLGPIEHNPQQLFGEQMLHGAQMAIDEANSRGGYGGKPFRLMLHNDYDNWQAKAVYGDDRPTDPSIWGSASNEVVKMVYDEQDWAIFGSISSESTHIALRVALRAEIPIVNSASTDPTIPETYIPWYFTDLQDDRVQSLTLARHIFTELGLKRVALLRVNERYGRFGVPKFRDAARRLGHPVVIEQKYFPGDTDFAQQLRVIGSSRADAVVIWGDEIPTALILKQMREAGMRQPVYGAYRTLGPTMLAKAGSAAEGFSAVFPYDPTRPDSMWMEFNRRFKIRYKEDPEQFAALAFDAMNALLDSICKAGLNRARIHDALASIEEYEGVTGHMVFDPNQKNVSPMYLGTVHNGAITYRAASMESSRAHSSTSSEPAQGIPYARVGEEGVASLAPKRDEPASGSANEPRHVIIFGKGATEISNSTEVQEQLSVGKQGWDLLPVGTELDRKGADGNQSGANWGAASTALVHALMDQRAVAIVALDRDAAHLAEQLALKSFVPVIALSDDKALTSTNVPWIFRLPQATRPADALRLLRAAGLGGDASPEKLRKALASGEDVAGFSFKPTGELRGQ